MQIAGLKDFREQGPPADIGTFQFPASIIVFQFTFSGTTYNVAIQAGVGGWVPVCPSNTDATIVLQAAIDALASGKIFVHDGTYNVSSLSIEQKDNLVLEAESWNTRLIASGDLSVIVIGRRSEKAGEEVYKCTNIVIRGFYIEGSNQTAVIIEPHNDPDPMGCGIEVNSYSDDIIIEKNYIYDTGSDSIYGEFTGAALVKNNTVKHTRAYYASIHPHSTTSEWLILGNYIYDSQVEGIRHGHIIQGNFLSGIASWGIMGGDQKSTIVGNWMDDVFVGIHVYWAGTVVSGNRMYGTGDVAGGYGIVVRNETGDDGGSEVICNQIENFYTGIHNEPSAERAIIIGNRIENIYNFGILNNINSPGPIIIGNQITTVVSDGILYGTTAVIIGNVIDGVTTFDGIRDLGDGNIVKGNQFLNINRFSIRWVGGNVNNIVTGNYFSQTLNTLPTNSIIKDNIGFVTENNVLSPAFAITVVAIVAVVIPHGLDITPAVEDCQLTVIEDTDVDDWQEGFVKVESTDAANVNCKVNVTALSATGGATAKLALRVTAGGG